MKTYRFAFDLGTTSIGWAVLELDDKTGRPIAFAHTNKRNHAISFSPLGVRVFEDGRDPHSKASNAAARLAPRAARKGQDRRLARRAILLSDLEKASMLPPKGAERDALFAINPFELRARAASQEVTLHELGRALWHMSKHRGFKSNRRADRGEDDTGLIRSGSAALQIKLKEEGHATYGAYLWARLQAGQGIRVRVKGENDAKHYEFFPTRDMLEAEFDAIWAEQVKHHDLSDALRDRLRDYTIFYQRQLKPVEPGRCFFFPDKSRLSKWHPTAQAFLILQDLANLRVINDAGDLSLDLEKRRLLFAKLNSGEKLTWARVRKVLGLSSSDKLNLQEAGRKHLHYNEVAASLFGTEKKPGPLADHWKDQTPQQREEFLGRMADSESLEGLMDWLQGEYGLKQSAVEEVEKLGFPKRYLRSCKEATEALVVEMRRDTIDYDEAVQRAPLLSGADTSHSDYRPDKGLDTLPRYNELEQLRRMLGNGTGNPDDPPDKRLGKFPNPTVHIALGQFRRVMNMLIHEFGKPAEIVLEAALDLNKAPKEREEIDRRIKASAKRKDRYREELEKAGLIEPQQRVGNRLLKLRLWEELGQSETDRRSPFSGRPISRSELLSDAVEIEHILPFSETLDDSPANKILAFRDEIQSKAKLSPGEAAERGIFDQDRMIELTKHLPRYKAWRFRPDAMSVFKKPNSIDHQLLNATGYLARLMRAYTETLFDKTDTGGKKRQQVWMLSGRMTAMLRHRWRLSLGDDDRKNRHDYRDHAIDAAVIGVIDRAMIKQLRDEAKLEETETFSGVLPAPAEPFSGFRDEVITAAKRINISHRAKHGRADPADPSFTSGRLHEDTAFGLIHEIPENQADLTIGNVVVRKPVGSLSNKEIGQIRDAKIRQSALVAIEASKVPGLGKREADILRAEKLAKWADKYGHRRVRIIKRENALRPVCDREGRPYKFYAPGEVAFIDLIEFEDRWVGHPQSVWDANSGPQQTREELFPGGRIVMRLHKGDTIQLFDWDDEEGAIVAGSNAIKRVVRLAPGNNRIYLCGLYDAGKLQRRHEDEEDEFRWDLPGFDKLRLRRARRVRVDELGRVHTIPHGKV